MRASRWSCWTVACCRIPSVRDHDLVGIDNRRAGTWLPRTCSTWGRAVVADRVCGRSADGGSADRGIS